MTSLRLLLSRPLQLTREMDDGILARYYVSLIRQSLHLPQTSLQL
jgi:hypothetical protein